MIKNFNASIKGLIGGALMVLLSTIGQNFSNINTSFITISIYIIYFAAILWTLNDYSNKSEETKFSGYFIEAFKCIITVTLLMVLYVIIFLKTHPEMREKAVEAYKIQLENLKTKTTAEITKELEIARNSFNTIWIATSIFGYLILGVIFSLISSLFFVFRKKNI